VALLAVAVQPGRELLDADLAQQIGRARSLGRHPHVEGAVVAEREPAFALVELHRADAEVEEHAMDVGQTRVDHVLAEVPEVAGAEPEAFLGVVDAGGPQVAPQRGDPLGGARVLIDRQHPGAAREHGAGVAAGAEGGVDDPGVGPDGEVVEAAVQHDGDMGGAMRRRLPWSACCGFAADGRPEPAAVAHA
jgi:hypothetical protein